MQPDRPRTPRTLSGSLLELLHELFAFGADFVNEFGIRGELLRSRTFAAPVIMLPSQSIHRSSRNPMLSITGVSPSQVAVE